MGNKISYESCVFCKIIMNDDKNEIIFEDDKMILIKDIKPCADVHLLAIPKRHIKNINYLEKYDISLLEHLENETKGYLDKNYNEKNIKDLRYFLFIIYLFLLFFRMGFHVPPFYSITHLHLHCLIPPFFDRIKSYVKYDLILRDLYKQKKILENK